MRKFKELHLELLQNPKDAAAYLVAAVDSYKKDGNKEAFLLALQDITAAQLTAKSLAHQEIR